MTMAAWYNEIDPYAAEWLRNLIREGLIADGDVDERPVQEVAASDLADYQQCHFFAGIGGWSGALRLAGIADDVPVWTGSCPCQPFSLAGRQKGFADERHLWPSWQHLIRELRPAIILGEQVASASAWLGLVRGDLEALGYAVGAIPVEAASAGADHLRDRYWFVADRERGAGNWGTGEPKRKTKERTVADGVGKVELADANPARPQGRRLLSERAGQRAAGADGVADAAGERQYRREGAARSNGRDSTENSSLEWVVGADGKARRVKSGIRLLAHGVPNRVAKLRAFGNAIDLRPAAAFIRAAIGRCP